MMFFKFCIMSKSQKQEVLAYQKLCMNHFQIVTTLTIFIKNTCRKMTTDTITIKGLQIKITIEICGGF